MRSWNRSSVTAVSAAGPVHPADELDYAPLVPAPEKILCVGQNYRDHIAEMGNEPPAYPTIFAKFAPALVGAFDDIVLPAVSDAVDYEAELAVVIGRPVRHAVECDLMEENHQPVEFSQDQLVFNIRPFEIKTFKVWF